MELRMYSLSPRVAVAVLIPVETLRNPIRGVSFSAAYFLLAMLSVARMTMSKELSVSSWTPSRTFWMVSCLWALG